MKGKHLTEEMVYKVLPIRWDSYDILKTAQRRVYYNVVGATVGDILYITNYAYYKYGWNKERCISHTLHIIGNYRVGKEYAFKLYCRESAED